MALEIKPRTFWNPALPTKGKMKLPARGVFIHHSVSSEAAPLVASMRNIEATGKKRFGRFSYSYGAHRAEGVAEGAGKTVGAHTGGFARADGAQWNLVSFGYCLIGNYENAHLTDRQIDEFGEWCRHMVAAGALVPDFFISPHRDVKATACPGAHVIERWHDLVAAARTGTVDNNTTTTGDDDVIGPGSTGQAVEDLQAILWMWSDPTIVIDGEFGDATAEASLKHKAMLHSTVSRPHWIDPSSPLWSYRTFAMHFEFEQVIRGLNLAMASEDDVLDLADQEAPDLVDAPEG